MAADGDLLHDYINPTLLQSRPVFEPSRVLRGPFSSPHTSHDRLLREHALSRPRYRSRRSFAMSYDEKSEKVSVEKRENADSDASIHQIDTVGEHANAKLANPLEGVPQDRLLANAARFADAHGLGHLELEFKKGAMLAQEPLCYENNPMFTEDDRAVLRRELTHRWAQPTQLYYLVIMCSLAAAVQGVGSFPTPAPRASH